MKFLFLIDGAAGTGKTDMVSYIAKQYQPSGTATVVRKFTTRDHRPEEIKHGAKLDLEFVTEHEFTARFNGSHCYVYEYGGERYAFEKEAVDSALRQFNCTFIIVRSLDVIQQLRRDYSRVRTVAVFVHSDGAQVRRRLKADGYDAAEIKFRLSRQDLVWDDYLTHPDLYNEIVINNSVKRDFQRLIQGLIAKYTDPPLDILPIAPDQSFSLPRALIGHRDEILRRVETYPYDRNVFLMMKFRDSNLLVFKFIAEQIDRSGFHCVRADQKEWDITSDVYNPIAVLHCCKYGIALFDEPEEDYTFSPNVAYELGMMHLQRKRCLILRHSSLPPMPFDLIKDLHRSYSKALELKAIVTDWLDDIRRS